MSDTKENAVEVILIDDDSDMTEKEIVPEVQPPPLDIYEKAKKLQEFHILLMKKLLTFKRPIEVDFSKFKKRCLQVFPDVPPVVILKTWQLLLKKQFSMTVRDVEKKLSQPDKTTNLNVSTTDPDVELIDPNQNNADEAHSSSFLHKEHTQPQKKIKHSEEYLKMLEQMNKEPTSPDCTIILSDSESSEIGDDVVVNTEIGDDVVVNTKAPKKASKKHKKCAKQNKPCGLLCAESKPPKKRKQKENRLLTAAELDQFTIKQRKFQKKAIKEMYYNEVQMVCNRLIDIVIPVHFDNELLKRFAAK